MDGLQIQYTGTATGDVGTIKLTQGVADQMATTLHYIIDEHDGYVGFKTESINDLIEDTQKTIDFQEDLLEKRMEVLTAKFVTMETMLNTMSSISGWLDSQIKSLSNL